jgi:hypothetical protein
MDISLAYGLRSVLLLGMGFITRSALIVFRWVVPWTVVIVDVVITSALTWYVAIDSVH